MTGMIDLERTSMWRREAASTWTRVPSLNHSMVSRGEPFTLHATENGNPSRTCPFVVWSKWIRYSKNTKYKNIDLLPHVLQHNARQLYIAGTLKEIINVSFSDRQMYHVKQIILYGDSCIHLND